MEIKRVMCDWCKQVCEGDSFSVFRSNIDGRIIGKSDYCEKCWNKMHKYPKEVKINES